MEKDLKSVENYQDKVQKGMLISEAINNAAIITAALIQRGSVRGNVIETYGRLIIKLYNESKKQKDELMKQ